MTDYSLPTDDGSDDENGLPRLTGIRNTYTLATTPQQGSETDQLMINNFLHTLAEVAIAVTSRDLQEEKEAGY
ncbi:hypothetical protein ACFLU3_00400 [Chloroflexota bacterium]